MSQVVMTNRKFVLNRANKINAFVLEDEYGNIIDNNSLESQEGKLLMVRKGNKHNPLQLFKVNCGNMLEFLQSHRIHVDEEDIYTILTKKSLKDCESVMTKSQWERTDRLVVSMYGPLLGYSVVAGKSLFLKATSSDTNKPLSSDDSSDKPLDTDDSSDEPQENDSSSSSAKDEIITHLRRVISACIDKMDRLEKSNKFLINRVHELEKCSDTNSGKLVALLEAIEKNIQDYHNTKTSKTKKKGTKKKKTEFYTIPERGLDDFYHFDDKSVSESSSSENETDEDFENKFINVVESIFWCPIKIDGKKFWLYRGNVYRKGKTWNQRCGVYGTAGIQTEGWFYYLEDGWEEKLFKSHPQLSYEMG